MLLGRVLEASVEAPPVAGVWLRCPAPFHQPIFYPRHRTEPRNFRSASILVDSCLRRRLGDVADVNIYIPGAGWGVLMLALATSVYHCIHGYNDEGVYKSLLSQAGKP